MLTSVVGVLSASVAHQSAALGAGAAAASANGGQDVGSAMTMIKQTQFLAIMGRVGGPDAQPEATRALSGGLAWANWHVFSLYPKSNTTDPSSRRAAKKNNQEPEGGSEGSGDAQGSEDVRTAGA
eukprot:1411842-Rhodomonas_salina.1